MEGPPTKPDWNRLFETASSQEGYRAWFGAVPTTNPRHTLNDCARASRLSCRGKPRSKLFGAGS